MQLSFVGARLPRPGRGDPAPTSSNEILGFQQRLRVDNHVVETEAQGRDADRQADQLGLRGTPMIYINGRYFDLDHFELPDLARWVALEIELATGKRPTPAAKPRPVKRIGVPG